MERIAKVIASRGFCSRRDAERLIAGGMVKVNGELINTPALKVSIDAKIEIGDQLVAAKDETIRVWLLNKPREVITTHHDPQGRPTVFSILPADMPRVISVGRLDYNTEGLLILTNSGTLARQMELPSSKLTRKYLCRAKGRISPEMIATMAGGCEVDGIYYSSIKVSLGQQKGANTWVTVSLQEGKNREIRKVFAHFGLLVSRLIRVQYGPFQLGDLPVGKVQEMEYDLIMKLIKQLPSSAIKGKHNGQ